MLPTIPSLRKPEYQISNSLRFRSSASAYLSRTPSVTGSQTTWTWSGWIKRGALAGSSGTVYGIFGAGTDNSANRTLFWFDSGDKLVYQQGNTSLRTTTAVFRDTSAWGHLVVAVDNSNSTAANRILMYWNGVLLATTGTGDPGSTQINLVNVSMKIGTRTNPPTTECFDGYMAEVHFVDGQALTPAAFGVTSSKTGVWAPRKYTGTYGTNGFYLDFVDNSAATSAAIGKDRSGNYNSWTPTNISMVAGSTYDSMTDTPTQYGDAAYYYSGTQYPYNALNFRSSASTYLSRTASSPTNNQKFTWSGWIKRVSVGASDLFGAATGAGNYTDLAFTSNNNITYVDFATGTRAQLITTQAFSDLSSWYHIVLATDVTNAIAADRTILYVNGSRITQFTTNTTYSTSVSPYINQNGVSQQIGGLPAATFTSYFNGYMADVNFIDGQALTPASFGETINGTWVPKTYTGTYGTNGFNLKFNDNSAATAAALGRDSAGTNNWTPTNLATTDVTSTEITSRRLVNPSYGLQFRSSASAYLSTTLAAPTNNKICTWSSWVKGSSALASAPHTLINANPNSTTNGFYIVKALVSSNDFGVAQISGGSNVIRCSTVNTFSDAAAWYHVVVAIDTTQATNSNGVKLYVNGVQQTLTFTAYSQNASLSLNSALPHQIGRTTTASNGSTSYLDGILADINFIDGQALTPSSFGETDSTGTWVPKAYTGTYGTNGFYLNFADRSAMTPAAIGNDASSNSNNWQPNNMAISDAIDYGVKSVRGNYAVINAVSTGLKSSASTFSTSITNSNLTVTAQGTEGVNNSTVLTTAVIPAAGKWYWEWTAVTVPTTQPVRGGFGIMSTAAAQSQYAGDGHYVAAGLSYSYNANGQKVQGGTGISAVFTNYGAAFSSNSVIGCAFDSDAGSITFYKDGVAQGTAFTGIDTAAGFIPYAGYWISAHANFGQRPFAYTPPAGFKALCTHNLPDPAIVHGHAYMAATTYTGTGVGRNISNYSNNRSFRPDLVWIKSRSNATDHALYDTLRGAQQDLVSNSTAAETTQSTGLTAFNEDGFGLSTLTKLNSAGNTYVAWQWKAGDGVVTNTAGSITSQVDAGTTQGVSVVTYTGTGANATVGHGLGVAPKMVIVRCRNLSGAHTAVYHSNLTSAAYGIYLDITNSQESLPAYWNSTSPTSSVFSIGTNSDLNSSGKSYVAYCFAEIAGYSKFGSYTGNGSADGPFCFTGFRPKFVMIKGATVISNWNIYDSQRSSFNVVGDILHPALPDKEGVASQADIDILSNGFKLREGGVINPNTTGDTFIFAAFAEVPSKYALAR